MSFTFKEWQSIRHDLEVAAREYEKQMNDSKISDDYLSMHQIFKRQMEETHRLIKKIDESII